MSNSTGRDGAQSQIMTVSTPGIRPDGWVEGRFTRPRSAMDAQFHFTMSNRFTAPFVGILDDATARLASAAFRYVVPAIDRRLNSRQRRYIRRRLTREMNKAAAHALMYGRP